MKTKLPFLFLLALASGNLSAQSMYHFKYEVANDAGPIFYEAFFERELNGTGFIRVIYSDPHTNDQKLIDMETADAYYKNKKGYTDSSILFFEGVNPIVIKGDNKNNYVPQVFWFKIDYATGFYEPLGITSADGNMNADGTFTYSKLLSKQDLTQELAATFFTKADGLHESHFDKESIKRTGNSHLQNNKRLYKLIFANSQENKIGTTWSRTKIKF